MFPAMGREQTSAKAFDFYFTIAEILVDFRSNFVIDSPHASKSAPNGMATCGQRHRL